MYHGYHIFKAKQCVEPRICLCVSYTLYSLTACVVLVTTNKSALGIIHIKALSAPGSLKVLCLPALKFLSPVGQVVR